MQIGGEGFVGGMAGCAGLGQLFFFAEGAFGDPEGMGLGIEEFLLDGGVGFDDFLLHGAADDDDAAVVDAEYGFCYDVAGGG